MLTFKLWFWDWFGALVVLSCVLLFGVLVWWVGGFVHLFMAIGYPFHLVYTKLFGMAVTSLESFWFTIGWMILAIFFFGYIYPYLVNGLVKIILSIRGRV